MYFIVHDGECRCVGQARSADPFPFVFDEDLRLGMMGPEERSPEEAVETGLVYGDAGIVPFPGIFGGVLNGCDPARTAGAQSGDKKEENNDPEFHC